MSKSEPGPRRAYRQIYVSPEVATRVDGELPGVIGTTGRRLSRLEFLDAVITVGLRHLDEVAAALSRESDGEES